MWICGFANDFWLCLDLKLNLNFAWVCTMYLLTYLIGLYFVWYASFCKSLNLVCDSTNIYLLCLMSRNEVSSDICFVYLSVVFDIL